MGENKKAAWEETRQRFVNPYNFVPFEPKIKAPDRGEDVQTGYMECQMEVLTPLIIPNTSNDHALHERKEENDGSCSYNFFSYENLEGETMQRQFSEPVIPGPEIRGVIRSVYEAAFYGCVSVVDLNRILQRRSPEAKRAGILCKQGEKWVVKPCELRKISTKNKYISDKYKTWKEGQAVFISRSGKPAKVAEHESEIEGEDKKGGWNRGYLHKGEYFETKKYESVFVEKDQTPLDVEKNEVDFLKRVIKDYRDTKKNKECDQDGCWYSGYEVDETQTLVYYQLIDGKVRYLSPACIGKELFKTKMENLLEASKVSPCKNRDSLCPACALFGMVAKEKQKNGAAGSKVRFTDAVLLKQDQEFEDYYHPDITLPEMGEPKPGAVEFYTVPPLKKNKEGSYRYWTYDYYKVDDKKRISFTEDIKLQLRGRKFYWHSKPNLLEMKEYQTAEPTKMRQKVRPLKTIKENEKICFQFRIYFEDISLQELKQLCWALDFDDASCAHKLGRGKPLGFGSVQFKIQDVFLRTIDHETGLWDLSKISKELKINSQSPRKDLLITNPMKTLRQIMQYDRKFASEIGYPLGEVKGKEESENGTASHQWFLGNRSRTGKATESRPEFAKVLPTIEEEMGAKTEKWLYKLEKHK